MREPREQQRRVRAAEDGCSDTSSQQSESKSGTPKHTRSRQRRQEAKYPVGNGPAPAADVSSGAKTPDSYANKEGESVSGSRLPEAEVVAQPTEESCCGCQMGPPGPAGIKIEQF